MVRGREGESDMYNYNGEGMAWLGLWLGNGLSLFRFSPPLLLRGFFIGEETLLTTSPFALLPPNIMGPTLCLFMGGEDKA